MGGTASLIGSVLGGLTGLVGANKDSDDIRKEREAREREQAMQEADERRRDREKVLEARQMESKRKATSLLSGGSASLRDAPEVSGKTLKNKLGE
ncbi:hypothetical protein [uncultured Pseudodesulfovibrio sp.]|uniref:hypothetical protein n=1 Tax=uncultured Pseudodesulfovibrio sp. TaxID=2035858 RepID=UPI0029C6DB87|nr:hypothetical protein [uncultured Pseudodesulfovibrio sp.]